MDAEAAFSFLAKPKDTEEKKKEDRDKCEDISDDKENQENTAEPAVVEEDPAVKPAEAPAVEAPPADDLFAKFMKKKSSTWICDICMVSNPIDADKCLACEAPNPNAKSSSSAPPSAPSFGSSSAPDTTPASSFQFGSSGGFKFGTTTSGENVKTGSSGENKSGFQFGSSTTTADNTNSGATSGFVFGTTTSTDKNDASGGFKFGTTSSESSTDNNAAAGGFKFGSSSEEKEETKKDEATGGFSFGTTSEKPASTGGFSFGVSSSDSVKTVSNTPAGSADLAGNKGFSFSDKMGLKLEVNNSDTPKTKSRKVEYHSNLKALNVQVTSWIKSHVDTNPLVDLTPVFRDYERHISDLKTKYNMIQTVEKKEIKEVTKTLFGVGAVSTTSASPFTTTASPFTSTFGSNQTNTSGSTGFSFGFLNKNDSKTETSTEKDDDDAGDEEHSSPKKEVEPVVEEGAVYSKKCKLYYKKDDAYVERGLGNIHLKMTEEKKLQLIIRAGTSLGNILLNIIMTSTTPLERLGKNNVMLVTVPNPPLEKQDETNPAPVTFLIRVKTAEEADELKEKITNLTN